MLGGPRKQAAVTARTAGFVEGLEEEGVAPGDIRIVHGQLTRLGGFNAAQQLFAEGRGSIDVVVAANDLLAIGALAGFRARGVTVPAELSVTGFDDIQLAVDVTPRLTTMALPLAEAGAEAIRLAVGTADVEPAHLMLRGRLVVRDSTASRQSP